jgi:S1-C subfamily serine protease
VNRPLATVAAMALLAHSACAGRAGDDAVEAVDDTDVVDVVDTAVVDVVDVVEIAATPCDTPNRRRGVGVLVDEQLVLTAGHVVDGAVRAVTVDGTPARVVAVAPRLDAALVATDARLDVGTAVLAGAPEAPAPVRVVVPDDVTQASIARRTDVVVHDVTARREHRRRALVLSVAVERGTSGAPVVDEHGRVVAMVTMTDRAGVLTYATDAAELIGFVHAHGSGLPERGTPRLDRHSECS